MTVFIFLGELSL